MDTAASRIRSQWIRLAELLGAVAASLPELTDDIVDDIHNRLYDRLVVAGAVSTDDATPPQPFYDPVNERQVTITGRQNTRVVDVALPTGRGSYAILHAARCALPDVAATLEEWEAWKAEH